MSVATEQKLISIMNQQIKIKINWSLKTLKLHNRIDAMYMRLLYVSK